MGSHHDKPIEPIKTAWLVISCTAMSLLLGLLILSELVNKFVVGKPQRLPPSNLMGLSGPTVRSAWKERMDRRRAFLPLKCWLCIIWWNHHHEKWLADHRDEQQPNGVLPIICPDRGWGYGYRQRVNWTSTIAIIPELICFMAIANTVWLKAGEC